MIKLLLHTQNITFFPWNFVYFGHCLMKLCIVLLFASLISTKQYICTPLWRVLFYSVPQFLREGGFLNKAISNYEEL